MRLTFLGTGASGGTPGSGRSGRRESSLLVTGPAAVLVDVTRHFPEQSEHVPDLDGVLLTHAHRDAAGGLVALRGWWAERGTMPLRIYGPPQGIALLHERHRRLDGLELIGVDPGRRRRIGALQVVSVEVPHAREDRFRTYAWRLSRDGTTVVYASDVGRLEPSLRRFSRGADLLVIDGAMWRRTLFAHLTIDRDLPEVCRWPVHRILLTQIGRTACRHEELERQVAALCARAAPAWDGLVLDV
jgi:phosphoribosyl 1,2-cyclic phosphodiesterase